MGIPCRGVCQYATGKAAERRRGAGAEGPRTRRGPDRSGLRAGGRGPASHGRTIPYGVPSMISVHASTSPLSEPSSL